MKAVLAYHDKQVLPDGAIVELKIWQLAKPVAGSSHRLKGAPHIPISTDVGFPELITVQFMGLFAPAGTPKAVIGLIADVSRDILRKAEFQQKLIEDGFEPVLDSGPEQAAQFVREELARWTPVVTAAGIKAG